MKAKEVLLLYSGGLDSYLSACRLLDKGYHVNLIHFDNGSIVDTENILGGIKNLENRFTKEKVTYLGIVSTHGIMGRFRKIENMKLSAIIDQFGNTTLSQYQCLICRSAMYYYAAQIALEKEIPYVAEGARKSQRFVIEQPEMMEEYAMFLKKYGITLLAPVYNIEDDHERLLELSDFRVSTLTYESKCLLGYPIEDQYPIDEEVIASTIRLFRELVLPKMEQLMASEEEKLRMKDLEFYKKKVKWK